MASMRIKINSVDYRELVILLLFLVLPFFHKFSTFFIVILFAISLFEIIKTKEVPNFKIHWFLPVLFFYFTLSEWLSGGSWETLEKRWLLVLVPVLFCLQERITNEALRPKIYFAFVLGNVAAVFACLARAFFRSIKIQDGNWGFNSKIIEDSPYDFLTSAVMGGNHFFSTDFSWFMHPSYASMYIALALYMIFELYRVNFFSIRHSGILLIGFYLFFVLAVFLLGSKVGIFCSLVITIWILVEIKVAKTKKYSIIAAFVLTSSIVVVFNPRLQEFYSTLRTTDFIQPSARYGYSLRLLSWDASLDLIRNNLFLGVGEGQKREELIKVYKQKGYINPALQSHNSHNQYLDFLIGGGLIGFSIFIVGLCQLFFLSAKRKDAIFFIFLFLFSFNALFENMLSRHAGVLFFSIFVTLLLSNSKLKPMRRHLEH
jgi:O-antigen ligase